MINMCENPIYCDACGDCIICYGEDPCPFTEDGRHIPPQDDGIRFEPIDET